jgi:hypothetical protein
VRARGHHVGNADALAALFPAAFQLMRRNGPPHRKSALNPDIRFPSFCVIFCKNNYRNRFQFDDVQRGSVASRSPKPVSFS